MSGNGKRRSMVLRRVEEGALTLEQATRILGLSYRQMKRVWKRFRDEGEAGLEHRSRGRPSNRAFLDEFKARLLERYHREAEGTGPTQFAALLREEGVRIDHETVRRWLLETGGWRLDRGRPQGLAAGPGVQGFGELLSLVSLNGSWPGEDPAAGFLLCLVDEATSVTLCRLATEESSAAAMRLLWKWVDRYGIPAALRFPRRFATENSDVRPEDPGGQARSALSLCCERLGIAVDCLSPAEAKHALDGARPVARLVREELSARRARGVEEANALLADGLGDEVNRRCLAAVDGPPDYHVAITDGTDLRCYFCVRRECRVGSIGVVEWDRRKLQLLDGPAGRQETVMVCEWLDGSLHVLADRTEVPFQEITGQAPGGRPAGASGRLAI